MVIASASAVASAIASAVASAVVVVVFGTELRFECAVSELC